MASAEELRRLGNDAFQADKLQLSIRLYSQAIDLAPEDHLLWSNRSAAKARAKDFAGALEDAQQCVALCPGFVKGHARMGAACYGLGRFQEACAAFEEGLKYEPSSAMLRSGIADARAASNGRSGMALYVAADFGAAGAVLSMLADGVDVNWSFPPDPANGLDPASLTEADLAQAERLVTAQDRLRGMGSMASWDSHDGKSALMAAAGNGHADVVRVLLEAGANVNQARTGSLGALGAHPLDTQPRPASAQSQTEVGMRQTALMMAAGEAHAEVVELLLQHGAEVNQADIRGHTALTDVLDREPGEDFGAQQLRTIQLLLDAGAKPDKARKSDGSPPLSIAARRGNVEALQRLLSAGASVNQRARDGCSALHWACLFDRPEVVRLLLSHGADTSLCPYSVNTPPLYLAADGGCDECLRLLLAAGADATVMVAGHTALYAAIDSGRTAAAKLLIDSGRVDLNKENAKNKNTPLHNAAYYGNVEVVRHLLAAGADHGRIGQDGFTPLMEAVGAGHAEVARCLIQHGVDLSVKGKYGTALHCAVNAGHASIALLLIRGGADLWQREDSHGLTAKQVALNLGWPTTARMLQVAEDALRSGKPLPADLGAYATDTGSEYVKKQQVAERDRLAENRLQEMHDSSVASASRVRPDAKACSQCGVSGVALKACSGCRVASYCGAECQRLAWRQGGHKAECAVLKGRKGGRPSD